MIAKVLRGGVQLLLAAIILQMATLAAIAAVRSRHVARAPAVTSASLLIDTLRLDEERETVDLMIDWDGLYRKCGVEPGALGQPTADITSMPDWSPDQARSWLSAQQQVTRDRWEHGAVVRRLEASSTNFQRHFLLGCISGTVFAPICRANAETLVQHANDGKNDAETDRRIEWLSRWDAQTRCVFIRGVARERLNPEDKK